MATLVEYETGRLSYYDLVNRVRTHGKKRSPRGIETYDLGPTTVVLQSPYDAMPLGMGRALMTAIGAAEAMQLIAGHVDHTLLPRISPIFERYLEPTTQRFHGAYGDRVGEQLTHVVRKLRNDRDTRQAVVTLWNPVLDNVFAARDFPCTVALNFAIEDDHLVMRTQMRSNDIWLGYPYDIFMFTQLQITLARALRVEPGVYTHSAWSLHLYAHNADQVDKLSKTVSESPYSPTGFGRDGESWIQCRHICNLILAGLGTLDTPDAVGIRPLTKSEEWYVERLAPYIAKA